MKRRNCLLALCLCFALLLSCLPTVSADFIEMPIAVQTLDSFKNELLSSGRIEQDVLEQYINMLCPVVPQYPDDHDRCVTLLKDYIRSKEAEQIAAKYEAMAAAIDKGIEVYEEHTKICRDYYAQNEGIHKFAKQDDVFIRKYYGCYNGVHVVLMDVVGKIYTDDMLGLYVDGILFEFPSGGCEAMFLAYKDGEFLRVADAYEQGLLTKSNLISMLPIHYENYKHLPFRDVDNGGWYEDAAWYVFLNGLFTGVSSYRFAPEDTLSRAMLATVLWRSQGAPATHPSTYFTDVEEGSWYAEAVAWADRQLIVFGTGNRKFSPNDPVTRETFATMLYRMSGADESSPEKAPDFKDLSTVSSWAKDAVDWAIEEEILQGIEQEDGLYLAPTRPITRAEAAAMLMRYMGGTSPDMKAVDLMEDYYPQIIDPNSSMTEESMEAIAEFSVSLFQKTVSEDENTVMSPLSVLYALTMLTNGAEGRTLEELEQTLGLSREDLNQAMYLLRSALNDRFCNVNVANSIWIRDGFEVAPEFLRENAKWLDADAYQAPYDDSTVKDMNNWISHNTDGMIEDMVQELSPETVLTLINALLFQSDWSDPYQGTREAPFYRADGTTETADMLRSSEYLYLHDDMATGFRKSFDSRKYDFAVIVPNEGVSLEEYIAQMDGASLRTMLQGEVYDAVYATMPAFSSEFTTEMSTILKEMGIRDAFDPHHADLSGIAEDLFVSNVTHKAVIEVEESGVSAGAATIVDIAPTTSVIEKTATVVADRPYLYMIIDTQTNLPLFMGTTLTVA